MAVCPKCNAVIDHLYSEATATGNALFYEDTNEPEFEEPEWETNEWKCPECMKIIAYDEDEVKEFFENRDELKEMVAKKVMENKK